MEKSLVFSWKIVSKASMGRLEHDAVTRVGSELERAVSFSLANEFGEKIGWVMLVRDVADLHLTALKARKEGGVTAQGVLNDYL